jgi:hypothetical protein
MAIFPQYNKSLLSRSGEIKEALVSYTQAEFGKVFRERLEKSFGMNAVFGMSEQERVRFFDSFITEELLPPEFGGGWVINRFLLENPIGQKLPAEEQDLLLNWRDNAVEGFFEIREFDTTAEATILYNLIDEQEYTVRSNIGVRVLSQFKSDQYIYTRLLPIEDYWQLSGPQTLFPGHLKPKIVLQAAKLAQRNPKLIFRNQVILQKGWDLQKKEHTSFSAFFGSDTLTVPGNELVSTLETYYRHRVETDKPSQGIEFTYDAVPQHNFPPKMLEAETVGVIYDEIEGLNFFVDFGTFEKAFQNPILLKDPDGLPYQVVQGYLVEPDISPLPFQRMIEKYPITASQVFEKLLTNTRNFKVERDFEDLMIQFKPQHMLLKKYPAVTMLPPTLEKALMQEKALTAPKTSGDWKRNPKKKGKK